MTGPIDPATPGWMVAADAYKDGCYNRIVRCLDLGLDEPDPARAAVWFGRAEEACARTADCLRSLAGVGGQEDDDG